MLQETESVCEPPAQTTLKRDNNKEWESILIPFSTWSWVKWLTSAWSGQRRERKKREVSLGMSCVVSLFLYLFLSHLSLHSLSSLVFLSFFFFSSPSPGSILSNSFSVSASRVSQEDSLETDALETLIIIHLNTWLSLGICLLFCPPFISTSVEENKYLWELEWKNCIPPEKQEGLLSSSSLFLFTFLLHPVL